MPITFIGKIIKRKRMKFIRTLLMTIMIYTIIGLSFIYADSITPGVIRTTLSAGERKYESVTFTNEQNNTVELSIKPYGYNPQTDEITEDTKDIFIKADTCLLYTSDAADDPLCVDLGGRRSIKKKISPTSSHCIITH